MSQPTPYTRGFSFTGFQAAQPSSPLPAPRVDVELDNIQTTLGGVLGNLQLIQRDDGKLRDGVVTIDSISAELLTTLTPRGGQDGVSPPAPNFTFEVHARAPGAGATLDITGAYPNLHLNFGVPKGDAALPGAATLEDGDYGDMVVSAGGTVFTVQTVNGYDVLTEIGTILAALDLKMNKSGDAGDFTTPGGAGTTGGVRIRADAGDAAAYLQITNNGATGQWGYFEFSPGGGCLWRGAGGLFDGGNRVYSAGNKPTKADVGLGNVDNTADTNKPISTAVAAALAGKQPVGAYATAADLATKADVFTVAPSFDFDLPITNTQNGQYLKFTGGTTRTITFGNPAMGHACILVNRGTVNMTIACPGGYYKNGVAPPATDNLTLAPGGKLTAFHEGGGVWTFDGTGF